MYLNYANNQWDTPQGYTTTSTALEINSCGTYQLDGSDYLETCRPNGRQDYQLLYIASGKGYFYKNEKAKATILPSGSIFVYAPENYQRYEFFGKHHTCVYWIHFTGEAISTLFSQYQLPISAQSFSVGSSYHYVALFDQIIEELQKKNPCYNESMRLYFQQLLLSMGRTQGISPKQSNTENIMETFTTYLQQHYQDPIDMDTYIRKQGYSISTFYRQFTQHIGCSPLQYLIQIRIKNAEMLLSSTNLSIGEIASMVGYENALYFSRIFAKHVGCPPSEYRKRLRNPVL